MHRWNVGYLVLVLPPNLNPDRRMERFAIEFPWRRIFYPVRAVMPVRAVLGLPDGVTVRVYLVVRLGFARKFKFRVPHPEHDINH